MRRSIIILTLFTATACPDNDEQPSDAGVVAPRDATTPVFPDAELPPMFAFEANDPPGPALVFTNATFDATQLSVDVAGRGLADVYGVAFRVAYDPSLLTFVSLTGAGAFTPGGLEQAAEGRPGLIVAAIGQVGRVNGVALDGVAVARVTFQRLGEVPVMLRLERGFALGANGLEIKVGVGTGNLQEQ